MNSDIKKLISYIYGETEFSYITLDELLSKWKKVFPYKPETEGKLDLDQKEIVMITYGNSIVNQKDKELPLKTLKKFSDKYLKDIISTEHILPFSPYSSDDGFSVIDYREINPELGSWKEINELNENFSLMFDVVLNHCSSQSEWFKEFLKGNPIYKDYFITENPDNPELKKVFRPRATFLLNEFETSNGNKWVWTTFSKDQVDLDFSNPKVLFEFIDIILYYAFQGAKIIRLDAIGFLWKELGTPCMHHPKTHAMVQLFRAILTEVSPKTVLLTETNVPHKDNISYFGNGFNEAQMVYQFALPPLTLDAFIRGDAHYLTQWAKELPPPNEYITFFNFLASHDGIGVLAIREILTQEEQKNLFDEIIKREGRISYKTTTDGEIPYELNINYLNAIAEKSLPTELRARKFLSAQSIILSMAGVPGIYIHSLLGSENWIEGVEKSGINRRINRESLSIELLEKELNKKDSLRSLIFEGYKNLILARKEYQAFKPSSMQKVLSLNKEVFALERSSSTETITCLTNTSALEIVIEENIQGENILEKKNVESPLILQPYQTIWIKK